MADSIDRVFAHALQTVRKIPRSGSARPPASERLKLYGLYKQSMEGDVEGVMERPSLLSPEQEGELTREEKAEVEKWDAWSSCAGLSRSEAKSRYIDTLISTMHTYAYGSVEAQELVHELEFVWDQVKSNAAFNSIDIGGTISSGSQRRKETNERTREGLRVLRPMSDQDDLEAEEEDQGPEVNQDPNGPSSSSNGRSTRRGGGESWEIRVDSALVRMTAEIAALREVVEARGRSIWGTKSSRQGWMSWAMGQFFGLVRRVLVDAAFVAMVLVVWKYRTGGPDEVVRIWIEGRERLRRRIKSLVDVGGNG